MSEQQTPQTAEEWHRFLVEKLPPVRLSVIKRLQHKLSDHNCSVIQLSKLIKADPLLCFHIALAAGKLHGEKKSEVTSLDHAISSLGLHKLEQLVNNLPTTRLNPSSTAQKMYFRAIANSHHAAIQVQQWLIQCRGGMFAEESYQAALFYNIGHWLLWYFAPLHMSKVQILVREKQVTPELAEARILGCTIDAISKRLLTSWPVSPLALVALENSSPLNRQIIMQLHQRALGDPRLEGDQLRQLNHLTQQKFFPVKLGNLLALNASYGWGKEPTLHLIDIINDYLRAELKQTFATLHKNCALAAQIYHVPGTLAPGAEMLMLDSDLTPAYRLTGTDIKLFNLPPLKQGLLHREENGSAFPTTKAATTSPTQNGSIRTKNPESTPKAPAALDVSESAASIKKAENIPVSANACNGSSNNGTTVPLTGESFLNEEIYKQHILRFSELNDYYANGTQVITDLLKGLTEGLGIQRVALNILPPKSDTLKVIKAIGFGEGHPLLLSTHKLSPKNLFYRLNEKPGCLLVNNENRQRIKAMLPSTFSRHVSNQNYLFMSLIATNGSVIIIYADREGNAGGVQSFHHKKFKDLCTAAGRCLDHVYKLRAGAKK